MLLYAAHALSIEKCHLVKTEVIKAMHHRCQLPFFIPGCQQHRHTHLHLFVHSDDGIPRLLPPTNTASNRRARGSAGLKAHLNKLRKKVAAAVAKGVTCCAHNTHNAADQ